MKRIMLAVLAMSLILCGCGKAGGEDNASSNAASQNQTTGSDAASVTANNKESVSENAEDEREPLTIGMSVSEDEIYEEFTFSRIPQDVKDLELIDGKYYEDPYCVAALAIMTMCNYTNNPEETINMLVYLNGTEGLTNYEKDFHNEELKDREYKPYSYLKGATPANEYTPDTPYVVRIYGDKYTWVLETRVKLFVNSSGADKPRAINVRLDEKTNRWCVYEHGLLGYMIAPGGEPAVSLEEEEEVEENTSEEDDRLEEELDEGEPYDDDELIEEQTNP